MNYKKIILGILVVPGALFGQSELEELKYQKQCEVRKILKEINDAYQNLINMWKVYNFSLDHSINGRLREPNNTLSEEELDTEITKENSAIYGHVLGALASKHRLDESLVFDTMFRDDSPDSFCADKFFQTSGLIEFIFIKDSLPRYKKAFQELIIINNQIHLHELSQ